MLLLLARKACGIPRLHDEPGRRFMQQPTRLTDWENQWRTLPLVAGPHAVSGCWVIATISPQTMFPASFPTASATKQIFKSFHTQVSLAQQLLEIPTLAQQPASFNLVLADFG